MSKLSKAIEHMDLARTTISNVENIKLVFARGEHGEKLFWFDEYQDLHTSTAIFKLEKAIEFAHWILDLVDDDEQIKDIDFIPEPKTKEIKSLRIMHPKLGLTPCEASEYLGVSIRILERLRANGRGAKYITVWHGKKPRIYYPLSELKAWAYDYTKHNFEEKK
jgi:hypothetical protein